MPAFTCGGMRFQHTWDDAPLAEVPAEGQANVEAVVRRALELGINHFETSRGYGTSERQLGLVLPKLARDEIIVQTKLPPMADADRFVARFHESLQRMHLDRLDLIAIHGINTYEHLWWSIRPGGCLAAARRMVAEGKAGHVGFSTHGPLDLILAAIGHRGDGGFDYVNLHWYYIFQQNRQAVEAAARADMGVFLISPSDKGGMLYRPPDKLADLCRPLHPLVFNCLFCLAHPEVHTLAIGAARPSDFDLQLTALGLLDRAGELLPPIEARLEGAMRDALGAHAAKRYAEGLPPWHRTPGYVNMPGVLWMRAIALVYGLTEYARKRYNLLGGGIGHWLPGMNAGAVDRLDLTKALAHSPFKDRVPDWLREAHAMLHRAPEKRLSEG